MTTKVKKKQKKIDRHATREVSDEDLTAEQLYQREYHRNNRERRAELRRQRRLKDRKFREQDIQRLRQRREEKRKEVAEEKFTQLVEEKRAEAKPTRRPRLVEIEGDRVYVYGTGTLSREVGREDATIRAWLAQGVLPGASVWIGRRAQFTPEFCAAVRAACVKVLQEDGRGDLSILRQLIREEFEDRDISFVRKGEVGRRKF